MCKRGACAVTKNAWLVGQHTGKTARIHSHNASVIFFNLRTGRTMRWHQSNYIANDPE